MFAIFCIWFGIGLLRTRVYKRCKVNMFTNHKMARDCRLTFSKLRHFQFFYMVEVNISRHVAKCHQGLICRQEYVTTFQLDMAADCHVQLILLSHAGGSRGVGLCNQLCVCDFVCLSVCLRCKRKTVEPSTPNSVDSHVDIRDTHTARRALTLRSKGQRSRSRGYQTCCYLFRISMMSNFW